jgi:hypothetical protein
VSDPSSGVDVGEYLNIANDPDAPQIEETPDGGAIVTIGEAAESKPSEDGFYTNLAEILPDNILTNIASTLSRKIEEDKKAREERDKQYEEGIKRTGAGKDAPGGASFEGASRAVHPMIMEACADYESRIMKELFPPSGPCKEHIVGIVTTEKAERAKRKTEHMNYQLTTQIKEARATLETTLMQVPLGGSQFIRLTWDHKLKRPRCYFVPIDKVWLPYNAADFQSSHRRTYADTISAVEFRTRVDTKLYRDVALSPTSMRPEETRSEKASHKVEGVSDPGMNLDEDHEITETMEYLDVTEEMAGLLDHEKSGELYPYLITMEPKTKTILAMYRDWEEDDEAREPIEHLFEFPFLPWRGAFSIGFTQLIGSLSAAATGALRALLDSAHAQNAMTGFIMKGAGISGQTKRPGIGELVEVDCGIEAGDIRQKILLPPFNQPSPVLFQLLQFVVAAAQGTVRTSLDEMPSNQTSANTPVGTQLSRVEEALVVFSNIHGRAHAAMNRLLAGLHKLNKLYLPEIVRVDAAGKELLIRRADYDGPCDVQPVSDPTIYSDQQRFAQLQAIQQRADAKPQLYRERKVEIRWLKLMKVPDYEELLTDEPQPHEMNAVNENLAMSLGKPVVAFPEQDHLAHLQVLLDYMKSPALGSNALIAPTYLPLALHHAMEHIALYYAKHTVVTVEQASGTSIDQLMSTDTATKAKFDQLLAQASQQVVPEVEGLIKDAMPVLQQAMALVKQLSQQQPPQMDPVAATVQVSMAETQRKTAADQETAKLGQAKLQQAAAESARQDAIKAAQVKQQQDQDAADNATRFQETLHDNQTAVEIAQMKIGSGEGADLKNGESMAGGL